MGLYHRDLGDYAQRLMHVTRGSHHIADKLALYLWGAGRQTALLSAIALRYDPYRQAPEKTLTRYLSYLWRVRATKGTYRDPLRVLTLLENSRLTFNDLKPIRTFVQAPTRPRIAFV